MAGSRLGSSNLMLSKDPVGLIHLLFDIDSLISKRQLNLNEVSRRVFPLESLTHNLHFPKFYGDLLMSVDLVRASVSPAYCFAVPPVQSASGHKAASWDQKHIWTGRCKVVESAEGNGAIVLEHVDRDGVFAKCPLIDQNSCIPVTDSTRYFVLRIVDEASQRTALRTLPPNPP